MGWPVNLELAAGSNTHACLVDAWLLGKEALRRISCVALLCGSSIGRRLDWCCCQTPRLYFQKDEIRQMMISNFRLHP